MRCREAKSRLSRTAALDAPNSELQEHLRVCPKCAEEARLAETMQSILDAASVDDRAAMPPLAEARARIEAAERRQTASRKETRRVSIRRPLIGFGLAVAAALAVFLLVPFEYQQTIGYEVDVAGVHPGLVEDDITLCDMLYTLGLAEADVDILGCDTTCKVQVLHLKSRDEVQLVLAAFNSINSESVTADIRPIQETSSSSFLSRSRDDLL
jgi:hypothetical protein